MATHNNKIQNLTFLKHSRNVSPSVPGMLGWDEVAVGIATSSAIPMCEFFILSLVTKL